ncbi:MAG: glycosyl hydrolase family 28-related protein [Desulfobaccales bacterium]
MMVGFLALGFSVGSYKLPAALAAESAQQVGQNSRIDSIRQKLTQLKAELAQKKEKYSDQHPDVQKLRREIERLEQNLETVNPPKPAESIPKPAVAIPQQVQSHDSGLKPSGHLVEVKPGAHNLADTLANTASGTIVVLPGTHTLSASKTLAPAVTLRVLKGAIIHVQDGVTLTCNGTLEAGSYQIFSWNRTGKVAFGAGAMSEVLTKWWGAKGDNSTDDAPALQNLISGLEATAMTVTFSPGTYKINADLTFPHNLRIRLPKGAILAPHEIACSGTISTNTRKISGTVNVYKGSDRLDGINFANYYPGQWIVSPNNVWRQVRYRDTSTYLWVWQPYAADETGTFKVVNNKLAGTNTFFLTELKPYDFVYWDAGDANRHVVVIPRGAAKGGTDTNTSVRTTEYPNQAIPAASFTRSVRISINGSFTAGKYQVFSGRGVVQLWADNTPEVYPEWWGATAGVDLTWPTAQANSNAIEKAVYAQPACLIPTTGYGGTGALVKFGPGCYKIYRHIPLPGGVSLKGCGRGAPWYGNTIITPIRYTNLTTQGWPDISMVQATVEDYFGGGSGQEISDLALSAGGSYGTNLFYTRNMIYAYLDNQSSGYHLRIHDCGINGAVMNFAQNMTMVQNNYMSGFPAFYGGVDSFLQHNQIEGHLNNRCAHGTFDSTDGWTYTKWTINTGAGTATHTPGNLSPLSRAITQENGGGWQINVPGYVAIKYTITNNSNNGRLRVKVCGGWGPYRRGPTSGSATFVDLIHIEDPTDRAIQFAPQDSGNFSGAISHVACLANVLVLAIGNNNINGNILFSDGGSAVNLFLQSSGSVVTENQMGPGAMIGAVMNNAVPKVFANNAINSFEGAGILIWGNPTYGQIVGNHIRAGGQNFPPALAAISISQGSQEASSGGEGDVAPGLGYVCRNNHIQTSSLPGRSLATDGFSAGVFFPLVNNVIKNRRGPHGDWPLIEHNYGYDVAPTDKNADPTTYPEIPPGATAINNTSSSTPSVLYGSKFSVTRSVATDITDLLGGCRGKEVKLFFKDAHSTVRFDTSATLVCLSTGAGTKWTSTAGAWMLVTFGDDGKAYCIVYGGTWS